MQDPPVCLQSGGSDAHHRIPAVRCTMTAIRSETVSVARKVATPVQAQTRTSNVPAKVVDRTMDDQGSIERQDRDSYSVTALADVIDRSLHATIARFTGGISPAAIGNAYLDWAVHLAVAPGKHLQLVDHPVRKLRETLYAGGLGNPVLHRAARTGPAFH